MTLDEAIVHCEEVADCGSDTCAHEHKQLAAWLRELKTYREADLPRVERACDYCQEFDCYSCEYKTERGE